MVDPQWLHVETRRTARIAIAGTPGPDIHDLWIVLHGIGQLADSMLRKCAPLAGPGRLLVAPEGLSRFYRDAQYQRVGASWMTRLDREAEIADQVFYLDQVLLSLPRIDWDRCRLHLLGFSQGVATAWRWLAYGRPEPHTVVLWAGRPPAETSPDLARRLTAARLIFVYGTADPFISPALATAVLTPFQAHYPHLEVQTFAGGHLLDPEAMQTLAEQWARP